MIYRWCRKLHNWLGLLLVIQILLWFVSGLVMAIMPIDEVRGEHLVSQQSVDWQAAMVSPALVLQQHSPKAELALGQRFEGGDWVPVYTVQDQQQWYRYSALTGAQLVPLSAAEVADSAQSQYLGDGHISAVTLLSQVPSEVRHLPAPIWQVRFADANNTVFYLDTDSGAVQRVRTDEWRLFDFLWMLHIMDYEERTNFNNPLLITTSVLASLFTLTGIALLWRRYRPRVRTSA